MWRRGFTLVELLVVIAIIGILLGILPLPQAIGSSEPGHLGVRFVAMPFCCRLRTTPLPAAANAKASQHFAFTTASIVTTGGASELLTKTTTMVFNGWVSF